MFDHSSKTQLKITVSNDVATVSVELDYSLTALQVVELKMELTKMLEKIGAIHVS